MNISVKFHLLTTITALLLAGCSNGDSPSAVAVNEILTVDQVRAIPKGTPGYIRTVVEGTEPTDLSVTFFDVIGEAADGMIMARTADDRFKLYGGVVAGMSGAPLYLTDSTGGGEKLVGALSAAFLAQQEGEGYFFLATPIEAMFDDLLSKPRLKNETPAHPSAGGRFDFSPKFKEALRAAAGPGTVVPVPLTHLLSGATQERLDAYLTAAPAPEGLSLIREMNLSAADAKPGVSVNTTFNPGDTISAKIITGDLITWGAIGSVTWSDGQTLLAFGHPFLSIGETSLPFSGGKVYGVINNLFLPFKFALSGAQTMGTLTLESPSGVRGTIGVSPEMLGIQTFTPLPDGSVESADHSVAYTPLLPIAAALAAVLPADSSYAGSTDLTLSYNLDISFKETPLHLQRLDTISQYNPFPQAFLDLWWIMSSLWYSNLNRVALLTPTQITLIATVTQGRNDIELLEVASPPSITPGQDLTLTLKLQPFREAIQTQQEVIPIPTGFPTGDGLLTVGPAPLMEDWGISGSTAELLNNLATRRLRHNLKMTLESGPATLEQYIPLICSVPPCSGPVTGLIRHPITLQ